MITHEKTSTSYDQHRIAIDDGAEVGYHTTSNAIELHISHGGHSVTLSLHHETARAIAAILTGAVPPPRPQGEPAHG